MRTVKGKWYAGWDFEGREEYFDYFADAQKFVVAELSWVASDGPDWGVGNEFMSAASQLNGRISPDYDVNKTPWRWMSPEGFHYFIEWEPYPMSVTEMKLA